MEPNRPKKLAVLCGVAQYGRPFVDLPAVASDVNDLTNILKTGLDQAFCYEHVRTYLDRDLTLAKLQKILDDLKPDSPIEELLFYLAGHACIFREKVYFVTYGWEASNPGMRLDQLGEDLWSIGKNYTHRPKIFAVLDFCHAGATLDGFQAFHGNLPIEEASHLAVLAAARESERADAGSQGRQSLTQHFINALQHAPPNEDGFISWGQVALTAVEKMGKDSLIQRPVNYSSYLGSHFINRFAHSGRRPSSQGVSGELPAGYTNTDLQVYLDHVRDAFALLDLRGMSGASQSLSIPLEQVYVELQAEADNPTERDYDRLLFEQDVREQLEQLQHHEMDDDARQEQIYRVLARNAYELRLVQSGDFDSQGRPIVTKEHMVYLADVARRERRAVILGDPGSGKTTLLKYLAFHYARSLSAGAQHVLISRIDRSSDEEADNVVEDQPFAKQERDDELPETTIEEDWGPTRLPIYIRIAAYAEARKKNEHLPIQDFLPTYWHGLQLPLPETTIRAIFDDFLKRNNVLLLLDGLDEIADFKERQEIVRQIELLINAYVRDPLIDTADVKHNPKQAIEMRLPLHSGGNQVILTSRAAGYRAAPLRESISHYRIQDMSDTAIDAFLRRWCLAVEQRQGDSLSAVEQRRRAEAQRSSLTQAIQHPRIKRLAINPLLLTLLALLHRSEGRLPRLRIELYRNATRTLIETWRHTMLTEDEVLDVLGPVASWIHTNEPTGLISQGEMRHLVTEALAAWRGEDPEHLPGSFKDEVTNFLETVRRESGLLLERGQGLYSFAHLTFQEYFVARQITRRPADAGQFIQKHLADPRWREPLLLAVAQVAKEARGDLPPLLETALNAPVPHDDLLHRRLLFAAAVLPECAWVPPALVRRICSELLLHYADSLRQRRFARLRTEITNVYGSLRDSEAARLADETLCKALSGDNQDIMLAAAQLVVGTHWYTPSVLAALTRIQQTQLGNVEFQECYRQIECAADTAFPIENLPLRQAATRHAQAWRTLTTDPLLCDLLSLLYAPNSAGSFTTGWGTEHITRDGPCTALVMPALTADNPLNALRIACRQAWEHVSAHHAWAGIMLLLSDEQLADVEQWKHLLQEPIQQLFLLASMAVQTVAHTSYTYFDHISTAQAMVRADSVAAAVTAATRALDALQGLTDNRISSNSSRNDALSIFVKTINAYDKLLLTISSEREETDRQALRVIRALFRLGLLWSVREAEAQERSQGEAEPASTAGPAPVAPPTASASEPDESLTSDQIVNLVSKLRSQDDTVRDAAEQTLRRGYHVSKIGAESVLTLMVAISQTERSAGEPQAGYVGTVLEEATANLIHDDPKLVGDWIQQSNQAGEAIPDSMELLCQRFCHITPETVSVICEALRSSSSSVRSLLLESFVMIFKLVDRQPWENRSAECLQALTDALVVQIHEAAEELCIQAIYTCSYHPKPSLSLVESLSMLLDQADRTRNDYIAVLISTIGRLGYKLNEGLIDLESLRQDAKLPPLLAEVRQQVTDSRISNAEQLEEFLYGGLSIGPDDIARSLTRLIAESTDNVVAVLARLESLLLGDEPSYFQQEERALLARLEAQAAALLNHHDCEVRLMAGEAAVRLMLPDEQALGSEDISQIAQELLNSLSARISDPTTHLMALLESISGSESWDTIHDTVVTAAAMLVSRETALMPTLFQALADAQDWQHCDPVLGTVAKLAELSPALVNAYVEDRTELADKLIEYCSDLHSYDARSFALTALSHLRRISPALGQALLYCCTDVAKVRTAAVAAAKRFQHFEPDVLDVLVPALTGPSVNTAYTVTLLLRELGRVSRRLIDRVQLLERIALALAVACVHPESGRVADDADWDWSQVGGAQRQSLADACYEALIQVVG